MARAMDERIRSVGCLFIFLFARWNVAICTALAPVVVAPPRKVCIVGGTGQIGSAVAQHWLRRDPTASITLVGRSRIKGDRALREIREKFPRGAVTVDTMTMDQTQYHSSRPPPQEWVDYFHQYDCVIHTAGPYVDAYPTVLAAAIAAHVKVYVDVGDPLPYLEHAVLMDATARTAGTTAVVAAGAFPGMSNVLAVETAERVVEVSGNERVGDIRCQYFTAGLGGSGAINLYITNLGFGDAMGVYKGGELTFSTELPGKILGSVDFFLSGDQQPVDDDARRGNEESRRRVGKKQVFAWPFPEAATVPSFLRSRGDSIAGMGTAPDIWNSLLGFLVVLLPRSLWRKQGFSQFLADFSEPLVRLTDALLRLSDPQGIGETHAMRIDVTSAEGSRMASTVQAHDSFRQCVGQSCAEFALDCLESPDPGVSLPELRYSDGPTRACLIAKLTSTPGTFCYTGPVVGATDGSNSDGQASDRHFCSVSPKNTV